MKTLPERVDFIVVGAGVAGLRAAITLAEAGRVQAAHGQRDHLGGKPPTVAIASCTRTAIPQDAKSGGPSRPKLPPSRT